MCHPLQHLISSRSATLSNPRCVRLLTDRSAKPLAFTSSDPTHASLEYRTFLAHLRDSSAHKHPQRHGMSETAPLPTALEPDITNRHNTDTCSEHVDTAFSELAQALEPFIEDALAKPRFYKFEALPIELRYKIYEEHFLVNKGSLATQSWPHLTWQSRELRTRTSAPFLPRLCLASKTLLREVGAFLLSSILFDFETTKLMQRFIKKTKRFRHTDLNIVRHIRKVIIRNVNHFSDALVTCDSDPLDKEVAKSNLVASSLLPRFQNLYELYLTFYASMKFFSSELSLTDLSTITALNVGDYLEKFGPRSILRLENIRRIEIRGVSGHAELCALVSDPERYTIEHDTVEKLRPLSELASKIKEGFKSKGQDVGVRTLLYWGQGEEELTTIG